MDSHQNILEGSCANLKILDGCAHGNRFQSCTSMDKYVVHMATFNTILTHFGCPAEYLGAMDAC